MIANSLQFRLTRHHRDQACWHYNSAGSIRFFNLERSEYGHPYSRENLSDSRHGVPTAWGFGGVGAAGFLHYVRPDEERAFGKDSVLDNLEWFGRS